MKDKCSTLYSIIYLVLLLSFSFNLGFYSLFGVLGMVFVLGSLFLILLLGEKKVLRIIEGVEKWFAKNLSYRQKLYLNPWQILLFTSVVLAFLIEGLFYFEVGLFPLLIRFLFLVCAVVTVYLLTQKNMKTNLFWTLFLGAVLIKLLTIFSHPNPQIDVFDQYLLAPKFLLTGINPYQATFTKIYENVKPTYYAYFPGSLLLFIPTALFSIDPRFMLLAFESLAALIWYHYLKQRTFRDSWSLSAPLIFLFQPVSFFVLKQGFIESALFFFVVLLLFAEKKWQGVILGFLLSIKQTMIFLPLLLWPILKNRLRTFITAALVFLLITIPFVIWAPKDFFQDTVFYHLSSSTRSAPVKSLLTLNAFAGRAFGFQIPLLLNLLAWLAVLLILILYACKKNSYVLVILTIWYLAFFFFGTQGFANNYYFAQSLLLLFFSWRMGQVLPVAKLDSVYEK